MSSWVGFMEDGDRTSDYNAQEFIVNQIIGRLATSSLVRVTAVHAAGEVAAVGFLDCVPMVHQVDGAGKNPTPHGALNNVPYFRMQGGSDAVIIDPKVGDIGLAVFCSRDISTVKNSRQPNVPGSRRRYDMSDGLYVGGMLNGTPTQMVRFAADGVHVETPNKVMINAGSDVTITTPGDFTVQSNNFVIDGTGNTLAQGSLTATGAVVAGQGTDDQVNLQTHHHVGNGPPVPGS